MANARQNSKIRDEQTKMLKKIHDEKGISELLKMFDVFDWGEFTLEEIGIILGVTRERVRQIQDSALKKLIHPKYGRKLKHYIEDFSKPESHQMDNGRESNSQII